jgi:hypothetical protein
VQSCRRESSAGAWRTRGDGGGSRGRSEKGEPPVELLDPHHAQALSNRLSQSATCTLPGSALSFCLRNVSWLDLSLTTTELNVAPLSHSSDRSCVAYRSMPSHYNQIRPGGSYPCLFVGCSRVLLSENGRTLHMVSMHQMHPSDFFDDNEPPRPTAPNALPTAPASPPSPPTVNPRRATVEDAPDEDDDNEVLPPPSSPPMQFGFDEDLRQDPPNGPRSPRAPAAEAARPAPGRNKRHTHPHLTGMFSSFSSFSLCY